MAISTARNLVRGIRGCGDHAEKRFATHAKTFYFACRFLPSAERAATVRLYAFFRTLDDLVDEPDSVPACGNDVRGELSVWREWLVSGMHANCPRPEVGHPLADVVRSYHVPVSLFCDFLDGMEFDLGSKPVNSLEQLELYSYQVAATVGLSMAHVLGALDQKALTAAHRLGIAMQLTNILRDVGGDLDRGRVYLPRHEMAKFQLESADLARMLEDGKGPDWRFKRLLANLIDRADWHYSAGIAGVRFLPPRSQPGILVAARLYQRILRELERNDYDSLLTRVSTSKAQKAREAVRCMVMSPRESGTSDRSAVVDRANSPLERS